MVYNLDARAEDSPMYLRAYASVVSSFITHGYRDEVDNAIGDICEKADECGLLGAAWVGEFKKKAGLFADDTDSDEGDEDKEDS